MVPKIEVFREEKSGRRLPKIGKIGGLCIYTWTNPSRIQWIDAEVSISFSAAASVSGPQIEAFGVFWTVMELIAHALVEICKSNLALKKTIVTSMRDSVISSSTVLRHPHTYIYKYRITDVFTNKATNELAMSLN